MRTCNWGYCTMLSTLDYLPAVLTLAESLKKVNSRFPLMVATTSDIYDEAEPILKSANCFVEKIEKLSYSKETIDKTLKEQSIPSVLNTASKIELFKSAWEKLVYIDADCLVLQNVDDLFNWPNGSMVKYSDDQHGFSGLMVISPHMHEYEFYRYLLENTACYDGDLIGKLWFQCRTDPAYQIPEHYLIQYVKELGNMHIEPNKWYDMKIIHFCNNPKPWLVRPESADESWYMYQYMQEIERVIKKYHLEKYSPIV